MTNSRHIPFCYSQTRSFFLHHRITTAHGFHIFLLISFPFEGLMKCSKDDREINSVPCCSTYGECREWLDLILNITRCCIFAGFNNSGITHNNGMIRHIKIHISAWRNQNIVSNQDFSNNYCIHTYPYRITNYRNTFQFAAIGLANCYSRRQVAILADRSELIDHYRTKMSDIKTFANICMIGYLDRESMTASSQEKSCNNSHYGCRSVSSCQPIIKNIPVSRFFNKSFQETFKTSFCRISVEIRFAVAAHAEYLVKAIDRDQANMLNRIYATVFLFCRLHLL